MARGWVLVIKETREITWSGWPKPIYLDTSKSSGLLADHRRVYREAGVGGGQGMGSGASSLALNTSRATSRQIMCPSEPQSPHP